GARVTHLDVERLDAPREEVEHPDGRDRNEQSDSGGHQSFGNTAGNRAETGRFLGRNTLERVDDADHGTEQSDEWSGGADGGQPRYTALQFGVDDRFGALEGTLRGLDLFTRNFRAHLMRLKLL